MANAGGHRTDAGADFANNLLPGKGLTELTVAAGDVVTFSTYTSGGLGHYLGVELNIALVPEPASLSLLALGGLALLRRRGKSIAR